MSLEFQDYEVMEQIIRICQSRGVFKPEEMIHVGILYKKIVEILEKTKKTADPMSMLGAFPGIGGMRISGRDSGTSMSM